MLLEPIKEVMNNSLKINTLFGLAALLVFSCMAVIVFKSDLDEYSKGIITLIIGRGFGYLDNIYNYETGTTRSTVKADDTIKELAKTTVPAPASVPVPVPITKDNV